MIYLDNNATTQIAPEVLEAMAECLAENFGNPSSAHAAGRSARKIIGDARESVANLLGGNDLNEIVFTSGGTESDNWAILGSIEASVNRKHIITTGVEHEAVRKVCEKLERQGFRVTWLDVDEEGSLDLEQLRDSLDTETVIVSVMMANNETGVVFPVADISEIVKSYSNALFHVDGVNAAGKIAIDLKKTAIDLFSISAHKFHGPKGIGALYVRQGVKLPSMLIGGGQESGRRAGTEAVHQIAGLGVAAKLASDLVPMESVREMRDLLENAILSSIPVATLNGTANTARRLPNTSNISFENINGEMILHLLNEAGICVSTGSACNSESRTSSPILQAMNVPYSKSMGSIRFSLSRQNTIGEINQTVEALRPIFESLRELSR
jgi:cysteine desulfurase